MTTAATLIAYVQIALVAFIAAIAVYGAFALGDGIAKRRAEGKPVLDMTGIKKAFSKKKAKTKTAKATA